MSTIENVTEEKVVTILKDYEDALSDGYGYYCEEDETLKEIAKKVVKAVLDDTIPI